MFSPFVSKFAKRVLSARYSDTRSLREQAGITPFLRDSLPRRSPRSSLASRRVHGALGHARQRARDGNTTYLPRRAFASPQKFTEEDHDTLLVEIHVRPTAETNLGKQKPDCRRLKTSSLIDPSYGTKAAAQFALQVIESCTTRRF